MDNKSMFRYFNVDLFLASIFRCSDQNSFTAFFTCSVHFPVVTNFNCKSCNQLLYSTVVTRLIVQVYGYLTFISIFSFSDVMRL